jgi:prepilin-type N-terminal cleavage/methylation domain-containing protein
MDRKKHHPEYDSVRSVKGFTIIELMIAVVLGSVVVLILYEMLSSQTRIYTLQDDMAEMQQNLRVAVERLSRDLTMAGFGKPAWSTINQVDASAWYNSGSSYRPYGITVSGTNNTIDIVGCTETVVAHLNGNAAAGSTAVTLQAGEGALFNTTTKSDINIGSVENAKVQSLAGDTLTIDIDPASGGNQGLQYDHGTDSLVCLVKWVTYSLGATDNVLYMDEHQGAGNQPIAQNITAMTISVSGNLLTLTLTGRSRNTDKWTGQYITSQVINKILLRN